ncbi:MAG: hypothetical protein QNK29_12905 [Desulfobacterales bacterium]|nr:hypothetical protein [Desulfobacterales bacterium]MDX2512864.1 hypothetical protein [Desulfobacterales bacterium]
MKKPSYAMGLFALILLMAVGCGGPKQLIVKEKSRDSGPPAWMSQAVTHPEYLYFVGLADRANSLKEGRDQARQDAANQASSYIGIQISTDTFIRDSTTQSSTYVNEQTRSSTGANISFLEVTDEYYVKTSRTAGNFYEEKYAVYVLCRFPKASAQKEKKRQSEAAQRDGNLALSLYRDALVQLDQKQPMAAFGKISRAQSLLAGISESVMLNHPDFKNTQTLSAAVNLNRQGLENRSRTINLDGKTPHGPAFTGAFAKAISPHDFELNPAIDATRFKLTATIVLHERKKIWDQFQYLATYTYGIKDLWTSNTITGGSGESKAFASSKEVASQNAVVEAASDIGLEAGKRLETYLSENTE